MSSDYAVGLPHPALRGLVGPYIGYCETLDPRAFHHGVPRPGATAIISFGEPLDVAWCDTPSARERLWCLAAGLHLRPSVIRTHGRQHGIQLEFTPAGCRALLGVPIGAIGGEIVDHGELPLGVKTHAHAELAAASGWPERWLILDRVLLRALATSRAGRPGAEAQAAWRALVASGGRLPIAVLAARLGWSRRRLSTKFGAEYGVSPKQAARLIRFTHARTRALAGEPLAEVAAATGYSDQSHLTREWRELAGQAPVASISEPFPILQDADAARGQALPA